MLHKLNTLTVRLDAEERTFEGPGQARRSYLQAEFLSRPHLDQNGPEWGLFTKWRRSGLRGTFAHGPMLDVWLVA